MPLTREEIVELLREPAQDISKKKNTFITLKKDFNGQERNGYLDLEETQNYIPSKIGRHYVDDLQNQDIMILAEILRNTTLTSVNLANNFLRDQGAGALAIALENNKTLTEVNLASNHIGIKGAVALAGALAKNTTLTSVNFSDNNQGAEALTTALKSNHNFEYDEATGLVGRVDFTPEAGD